MQNPQLLVDKLRQACLKRGASGIKGFARLFNVIDDDGSRRLDKAEFLKAINEYGLARSDAEVLFKHFDRDASGTIDYDEFLMNLRPPMSDARKEIILKAFQKMDKNSSGTITIDDLYGVYNVKSNPKYMRGELSEVKCFQEFLTSFDTPDHQDSIINIDEFMNYYAGVSASIDSDVYFIHMMFNAWKL